MNYLRIFLEGLRETKQTLVTTVGIQSRTETSTFRIRSASANRQPTLFISHKIVMGSGIWEFKNRSGHWTFVTHQRQVSSKVEARDSFLGKQC
jgi:hypothetical protein